MAAYVPLTVEWFVMVESLQHIASIALMEQHLPEKAKTEVRRFDLLMFSLSYADNIMGSR